MRQTKYALAVPKNLGLRFDFWLCSEGDFLTSVRCPCPSSCYAKPGDYLGISELVLESKHNL